MFRPFTFNVTSDVVGFRATILFFILCFSSWFLLCFYLLSCHLLDYLKLQYTCLTFQSLLVFTLPLQIKYKALQLHRSLYPPIYVIVVTCITCTYIKFPPDNVITFVFNSHTYFKELEKTISPFYLPIYLLFLLTFLHSAVPIFHWILPFSLKNFF